MTTEELERGQATPTEAEASAETNAAETPIAPVEAPAGQPPVVAPTEGIPAGTPESPEPQETAAPAESPETTTSAAVTQIIQQAYKPAAPITGASSNTAGKKKQEFASPYSFRKNDLFAQKVICTVLSIITTVCLFLPSIVLKYTDAYFIEEYGYKPEYVTIGAPASFLHFVLVASLIVLEIILLSYFFKDDIQKKGLLIAGLVGQVINVNFVSYVGYSLAKSRRGYRRYSLTAIGWITIVAGIVNVILLIILIVRTTRRVNEIWRRQRQAEYNMRRIKRF